MGCSCPFIKKKALSGVLTETPWFPGSNEISTGTYSRLASLCDFVQVDQWGVPDQSHHVPGNVQRRHGSCKTPKHERQGRVVDRSGHRYELTIPPSPFPEKLRANIPPPLALCLPVDKASWHVSTVLETTSQPYARPTRREYPSCSLPWPVWSCSGLVATVAGLPLPPRGCKPKSCSHFVGLQKALLRFPEGQGQYSFFPCLKE